MLFGKIRGCLGEMFHVLARQRESSILEGHLCKDHVHMYIAIPPKYAVAQVVRFTIHRILNAGDLKPHKVQHWCGKSPDPEFTSKQAAIIGL